MVKTLLQMFQLLLKNLVVTETCLEIQFVHLPVLLLPALPSQILTHLPLEEMKKQTRKFAIELKKLGFQEVLELQLLLKTLFWALRLLMKMQLSFLMKFFQMVRKPLFFLIMVRDMRKKLKVLGWNLLLILH